jgi:hypothetical protein
MTRYAYAIFCDDIRNEVGNKTSLMGIYNGLMYLSAMPAFIPRLGVSIKFCGPIDEKVQSLSFKILSSAQDEPILEMEIGTRDIAEGQGNPIVVPPDGNKDEGNRRSEVGFMSVLPPMQVAQDMFIRAIVVADGVEYLAGRLHISQGPRQEPSSQS